MTLDGGVTASQFEAAVSAEVDGWATPQQLAALNANQAAWRTALLTMIRDTEDRLTRARGLRGAERDLVVADLEAERERMGEAWTRLTAEQSPVRDTRRREPRDQRREPAAREGRDTRETRGARSAPPA